MKTNLFDFDLPESLIAHHPLAQRDGSRLLHVQSNGTIHDKQFSDIVDELRSGDVLVVNDSKVIPALLFGKRGEAKAECLLHKQLPSKNDKNHWLTFARPAKRLRIGERIIFAEDFYADIIAKQEDGQLEIAFNLTGADFWKALEQYGHMPLPPYIKREDEAADKNRYQTVYADREGSVAAPTAGLHFTPELLERVKAKGVQLAHVTLHVGAGTFQPVKVEDTSEHQMHSEWIEISAETAALINAAKKQGGRVVAVGTTSMRSLESAADASGVLHAYSGESDIFITPGYGFRIVDVLITNFHLPKSTLFMLVSAFSGLEAMQRAYAHAVEEKYRFYSYGDACFLERRN